MISKNWKLRSYPISKIEQNHFELVEEPMQGTTVVQNKFLTVDPSTKPLLNPTEIKTGDFIIGDAVGEVMESSRPDLKPGDIIVHKKGWREYAVLDDTEWVLKVPDTSIDLSFYLSILGSTARTAFVGATEVLKLHPGMQIGVSGATGAVGSVFAQIAKMHGCDVLGYTSSLEKMNWLKDELGIHAVNSNGLSLDKLDTETKNIFPNGFDAYQEHVDNMHILNAIMNMKEKTTISLCGMMKIYNQPMGPGPNIAMCIWKNINIQGFFIKHYSKEVSQDKFFEYMSVNLPKMKWKQTVVDGIEHMDRVFVDMYENFDKGKLIVKI